MNLFNNSVLNTILILFNSVIPENYLTYLCLAIIVITVMGMWLTYCLIKDNVTVPCIYVIPIIREIAILCKKANKKYTTIKSLGLISFIYATGLYIFTLKYGTSKLLSILILIAYFTSVVCFAMFNCYFFVETSMCGRKHLNPYVMISLYFLPSITLYYLYDKKKAENEKKKALKAKAKAATAKILVLAIIANTYLATTNVYAAEINNNTTYKVGCDICDNATSQVVLPLLIYDFGTEKENSCFAVTCPDCEIFHVIDEQVPSVPNSFDYSDIEYCCAFFDFNNSRYKTSNNYDAMLIGYNQNKNFAYIDNCFIDSKLVVKEKLYLQGVRDGVYIDNDTIHYDDGSDLLFPYFLTGQNLYNCNYESYWEGDASFYELTSDAIEFFPKNKNYQYKQNNILDENKHVTNLTNETTLPQYTYVDNEKTNDYTSNNNTYDNKFNVGNFLTKSVEKSLIAVATTGTFALLGAIASPAITTALAVTGSILTVTWLVERGYQLYKVYAGDYSCKEEQEAATYRYLEETTSDLVGLFTGIACYRMFNGMLNTSAKNKPTEYQNTVYEQNKSIPRLYKSTDYSQAKEWFDLADSIKSNNMKLPNNYITKSDLNSLGWHKGEFPSDYAYGKSVGGDIFHNNQNLLPVVEGRTYYEADVGYTSGSRKTGKGRLVWSNDGDFYYTIHYEEFYKLEW